MDRKIVLSCLALTSIVGLLGLAPLGSQATDKPSGSVKLVNAAALTGQTTKATVTIKIPAGWHAYQNPPTKDYQIPIVVAPVKADKTFKVTYPKGAMISSMGEETAAYEGTIQVPIQFKAPTKLGSYKSEIKVNYQICDDSQCLPPSSFTVVLNYKVVKSLPKKP